MKTFKAAGALALFALAFLPAAALGHTGAATVSCTGADFSFQDFPAGSNTINYKVTLDSGIAAEGTYRLDANGGREGHLVVALSLHDTHQVKAFAWWGPAGVENGETRPADSAALADQVLSCPATPAPAPVAPSAIAPVAAPAPAPATIGVLGEQVRAPAVRVAVQSACAARHTRVTVAARLMRQVRVSVAGRRARVIHVRPGARSVSALVALRRRGPAVQAVTTRITFRNGAPARTLTAAARRCGQAAVLPQFTG
jgi:hypothetical protein